MVSLVDQLKNFLQTLPTTNAHYFIGLSGGLDSVVLLHLLHQLKPALGFTLTVIHINHQLNSNANKWEDFCRTQAQNYDIPFLTQRLDSVPSQNIEAKLREARYKLFKQFIPADHVIFIGHHADDQAETVLLQLLRGSGIKGLSAMPALKKSETIWIARPLLTMTRQTLLTYAKHYQLQWIEDDSNADCRYQRNFLRHKIFPSLKSQWPGVVKTLQRTARHCYETQQLLDEQIRVLFLSVKGSTSNYLSLSALLKQPLSLQKHILRLWFDDLNVVQPSERRLNAILDDMLTAREDKQPFVHWKDNELRRFKDDLMVIKSLPKNIPLQHFQWDFESLLSLPGLGMLNATKTTGSGIKQSLQSVEIRFRQGGEKILLPGHQRRHLLKNLFQQWKIPEWLRSRLPLLYYNNELIAVADLAIAKNYQAYQDELGWTVTFEQHF